MHQALKLRQPDGINVPSERTVYRVMEEIGISHRPKRKPNGIIKSDRESRKSDDLIKRNFNVVRKNLLVMIQNPNPYSPL